MLRITLYKNCILNETYQNVVSTGLYQGKSILERYLDTLTKLVIPDVDFAYQKTADTLVFDYEINNSEIFEYNYMKVECFADDEEEPTFLFKRYCFVRDIQLNNDCVYLSYVEDVFSSYSDKITKITESYLSRARILNYGSKTINIHELPVEYDGNEPLLFSNEQPSSASRFVIFARIQFYTSTMFGVTNDRQYKFFKIVKRELESDGEDLHQVLTHSFTYKELVEFTSKLITRMTTASFRTHLGSDEYFYNIQDFYVLPETWFNNNFNNLFEELPEPDANANYIIFAEQGATLRDTIWACLRPLKPLYCASSVDIFSRTITNNYKRMSIGTFNTQIETENNGTDFNIKLTVRITENDFKILLNVQNQLVDISDDFIYVVPFESVLGEENFYNFMTRYTKNLKNGISIVASAMAGGMGFSASTSKIASLNSKINTLSYTKTGRPTRSAKALNTIARLENQKINIQSDMDNKIGSNIKESGYGLLEMFSDNLPVYTSNKGTFAKSDGIINAYCGILEYRINSENDSFVKKSINNMGYKVYEYCDNLDDIKFGNAEYMKEYQISYNVIKFERINVIGKFPRTIALALNEIFENGIKLWYDETITDDNLIVG